MPQGREAIPWSQMAALLVIARLCEPSSELHIAEDWYRKTALEDILGLDPERLYDNRLYRALDRLLPHKEAIERHLKKRLGELFDLEYDLLLYDVTSTYFEGLAEGNVLAARGYSRDHRPDCKQVCIALVVTRGGMPLGYEVFAGNRTDVTTVEEIVGTMEARYGQANRVWVMDRGMTSAQNVAWLQETQRRYLIGTPKSELRKWGSANRRGQGLEDGARRRRGQALHRARRRRDLRFMSLGAAAREREGDARAFRAANREEPALAQ
jgi:transposase